MTHTYAALLMVKVNRHLRQRRRIATIASAVAILVIGLRLSGILQIFEWAILDQFFRLRPSEATDPRILLVTVGESDIADLERWPVPDATLARVLLTIKQQQPRVIGLDLYRNLPVDPGHDQLVEVFRSTPNLIGIEKSIGDTYGSAITPPQILGELGQVSSSDVVVDGDGTVRRILLSVRDRQGEIRLGLAAKLALFYLQTEGIELQSVDPDRQHLRLGKADFLPLRANDGAYVRADVGGYQILSNFRQFPDGFPTISLSDVLKNRIPPGLMRDRIVLIGTTAASLGDRLHTPLSDRYTDLPGAPGVSIHADFISQILSAALDDRPLLRSWEEPWEWTWIILWAIGGTLMGWTLRSPKWTALSTVLTSSGLVIIAYVLFLDGWWIPLMPCLVALVGSVVMSESYILWDRLLLSKRQLEEYAQTLEQKVEARTHELSEKNDLLQREVYERQQTEIALQKAKETAESASRAKSRFLATMSHELRTPLNAILGYAQLMLQEDDLNASQEEYVTVIYQSGEHLLELINDVLTMSKIEAGRTTFNPDRFDLYQLIDNLAQMFRLRAELKGLRLAFERSPDLPRCIVTDEGKLRQVLINLIGNAIKFTRAGQIILRVGELDPTPANFNLAPDDLDSLPVFPENDLTDPTEQHRPVSSLILNFEVEDTGSGISEAEMGKLFQPFEQTESGRRSQQGTGLGLAISREFVHLMGGDIAVRSQVNQGTVFSFYLPVQLFDLQNDDSALKPSKATRN